MFYPAKQTAIAILQSIQGKKVALKNPEYNRYVVVEGSLHLVHAHDRDHGVHGHFDLILLRDNIVNIRSHQGHYIAIDKNGRVHTNHHPEHEDSQYFCVSNGNLVAFRTINHGRHLGIHHKSMEGHHSLTGGCWFQLFLGPY